MNVHAPAPTTRESFLDWLQFQERRHEFVNGRIIPVGGASLPHNVIAMNVAFGLRERFDRDRYHVFVADYAVSTHTGIRFPDIVVVRVDRTTRRFTEAPTLLIEILSPTSTAADMREKVDEYTRLPSLAAYVVLAQDEAVAHVWLKGDDGFPPEPMILTPAIAPSIDIAALGVTLPFADIYRGVL